MKLIFYIFSLALLFSCGATEKKEELDLMSHGMPIKIKAPLDSQVTSTDYGFAKDVTVKSGDDFDIQIVSSDALSRDIKGILAGKKKEVEDGLYFSKIIEEDESGFIFEKKITEEKLKYDFRLVKLQGDNEYVFQSGIIGNYNEKQIRDMYDALK